MKKVISHNTRNLVLGGVLRQETLKIGSGSGSKVGIFFNNGSVNLPGIRYRKEAGETVLTINPTYDTADFHMVDASATGYDRKWISDITKLGKQLFLQDHYESGSHGWCIYFADEDPDDFNNVRFLPMTQDVADPWNVSAWYEIAHDNTLTEFIQFKETITGVQQWEASKDGTNWYPLISGSGAITYSPIVITSTELVNGVATIQHNLGVKYPLGLDFTVTPDIVRFVDENTMTLNYSSHALTGFQAQVWFYKSEQSMLTGGASSQ